ncbi:MAG: hypothetical protein Q8R82_06440 [Hyphomonadaceae bacterium]|nr:hypothetical protein [Hyphomonadaceae bacterium]
MDLWLQIPYALNIAILVPVCFAMFAGRGQLTVFQGAVASSRGLELLVASLWLSILAASVAGIFYPVLFAPLLAMQVIYKTVWLLTFVGPAASAKARLPTGIAACFAGIVLTWPVFLWLAFLR